MGFFLAAIPWYVGAFVLICVRVHDHREKPGYVACTIAVSPSDPCNALQFPYFFNTIYLLRFSKFLVKRDRICNAAVKPPVERLPTRTGTLVLM
jgi:hypothetical protein